MQPVADLLLLGVLLVTAGSCWLDFRSMRIPNVHSFAIVAAFFAAFALAPQGFGPWWSHAGAFALMFSITFWMFSVGMMGGGDTKLASALALWIGLKGLMAYLLAMTVAGGVLGMIALWLRRQKPIAAPYPGGWIARVQGGESAVPYGIAISFGFWVFVFHTGKIHHIVDELFKIIH